MYVLVSSISGRFMGRAFGPICNSDHRQIAVPVTQVKIVGYGSHQVWSGHENAACAVQTMAPMGESHLVVIKVGFGETEQKARAYGVSLTRCS